METQVAAPVTQERLKELGFKVAAQRVDVARQLQRKTALAYEHYRYVTSEKMYAFCRSVLDNSGHAKQVVMTPVEGYAGIPPAYALDALEVAKKRGCFDTFMIASIEEVKDPILFGKITGCTDFFCIADWGEDLRISDLLKANEG